MAVLTNPPFNSTANHLADFCLHLADNSLLMGHRLSEWTGHGPMLEQDIALSNIALDLIGQSRNFYQYAAEIINSKGHTSAGDNQTLLTEDSLAYHRDAHDFKNVILAELPNGDWAKTILKLFYFSTYQFLLYEKLVTSVDKQLSAIAEKSLKEVTYHTRWSSEWVIRMGDGTIESARRLTKALGELQPYVAELFVAADYEIFCAGNSITADVNFLKKPWEKKVNDVFTPAKLTFPFFEITGEIDCAGKQGLHTEHLDKILTEMQYLQRTYPGCEW